MWTWLHNLIVLSSPVCAGLDTSWCKNECVFLSYLSKVIVVTHDLYRCEAETSCLMLCTRLHSWTELVFVQTDWDLACIPSWLCFLGEYSRRGNIPHIFACCRHYFKHNKNQKQGSAFHLCSSAVSLYEPVGTGLSQPVRRCCCCFRARRAANGGVSFGTSPQGTNGCPHFTTGGLKVRGSLIDTPAH